MTADWHGWMASRTQWTWAWASSGSWWWTGNPGVLQSMGSQRVGHDWVTELGECCYWCEFLFRPLKLLLICNNNIFLCYHLYVHWRNNFNFLIVWPKSLNFLPILDFDMPLSLILIVPVFWCEILSLDHLGARLELLTGLISILLYLRK